MSDRAFLDTNVFVYAMVQDDPRSHRAEELIAEGGRVSVQVLNEFAAVARRKTNMAWGEVQLALLGEDQSLGVAGAVVFGVGVLVDVVVHVLVGVAGAGLVPLGRVPDELLAQ